MQQCDKCYFKTNDNSKLQQHLSTLHLICIHCDYQTIYQKMLDKHILTHYLCSKCNYRTTHKGHFSRHVGIYFFL